jgi:hypothetical protein
LFAYFDQKKGHKPVNSITLLYASERGADFSKNEPMASFLVYSRIMVQRSMKIKNADLKNEKMGYH